MSSTALCGCELCAERGDPVPYGTCHCRCGETTPIATRNRYDRVGVVKGQPVRFAAHHTGQTTAPPGYDVVDRGYVTPCHIFRRAKFKGYGHARYKGKVMAAHRAAWEEAHGAIPKGLGLRLHHKCEVKSCVRVDHLELKPSQMAHMREHGRKLTLEKAREIRATPGPAWKVGEKFGVSASMIRAVRRGDSWVED